VQPPHSALSRLGRLLLQGCSLLHLRLVLLRSKPTLLLLVMPLLDASADERSGAGMQMQKCGAGMQMQKCQAVLLPVTCRGTAAC
jgi:hypothetical protein